MKVKRNPEYPKPQGWDQLLEELKGVDCIVTSSKYGYIRIESNPHFHNTIREACNRIGIHPEDSVIEDL